MAKNLFIVRHAEAEKPRLQQDIERKLTSTGVAKFMNSVDQLFEKQKQMDKMLVSAAERTKQTATLIRSKLNVHSVSISEDLYESSYEQLLRMVEKEDKSIEHLMIVGHNPVVHKVANYYSDQPVNTFAAGTIIKILFEVDGWQYLSKNSGEIKYII